MDSPSLNPKARKTLLEVARRAIEGRLGREGATPPRPQEEALNAPNGAFVTLRKKGDLRGCIGIFEGRKPLYQTVEEMAVAAAFDDPRFPPLREEEWKDVDLEISVLSPLRRITDPREIEVGKHGIYIIKGYQRGVLLPQVATEQGWDRDTFLAHTCLKAGLPPDAWKRDDVEIYVFTAEVFGESDAS